MTLRKLVQRKFLTFLSTRWGMAACVVGMLFLLNTTFSIVDHLLDNAAYSSPSSLFFRDWGNNIVGRSFEDNLCAPEIDVVYTWVNGSDPRLLEAIARTKSMLGDNSYLCTPKDEENAETSADKRNNHNDNNNDAATTSPASSTADAASQNCYRDSDSLSRFIDNEDLRYSLRSLEFNAPWVRNIYVVTNGQIPYWLDLSHPRIRLITHDMIFLNKSHLPTFSSPAIEAHLHRIPGLSNKFLYLNDDTLFSSPIWPDDFYTQGKGQKVFLAWPVPDCAPGCPAGWIKDGYCDVACNVSACSWDGGDCVGVAPNQGVGGGWSFPWSKNSEANQYCSWGCPDSWIGDKYCDEPCKNKDCGMDAGDCGVETVISNVYGANVTESGAVVEIPGDVLAAYVGLSGLVHEARIVDGSHEDSDLIRSATISQKHKLMTLTFHRNVTRQDVAISIKTSENDVETEYNIVLRAGLLPPSTIQQDHTTDAAEATTPTEEQHEEQEMDDNDAEQQQTVNNEERATQNVVEEHIVDRKLSEEEQALKAALERARNLRRLLAKEPVPLSRESDLISSFPPESPHQSQSYWAELEKKLKNQPPPSLFPWERSEWGKEEEKQQPEEQNANNNNNKQRRQLLDTFGDSLRFVNSLLDQEFGPSARNVIAHMPHMIDIQVMERLQARWPEHFAETSSHRFRSPKDMQYAFSYFYFLIHEKAGFEFEDVWQRFDGDGSGDLDYNELRTLATRLYGSPLSESTWNDFKAKLKDPLNLCALPQEQAQQEEQQQQQEDKEDQIHPPELTREEEEHEQEQQEGQQEREREEANTQNEGVAQAVELPNQEQQEQQQNENEDKQTEKQEEEEYIEEEIDPIRINKEELLSCEEVMNQLYNHQVSRSKNKYEVQGTDDVAFVMLSGNATSAQRMLDGIREHPRKFVCVNDDIDHTKPSSRRVLRYIRDLYNSLFPHPSAFELPEGQANAVLYWDEYQAMRLDAKRTSTQRRVIKWVTILSLATGFLYCLQRCLCGGGTMPFSNTKHRQRENRSLRFMNM
ncbi:N-acetylglucosamine-1-phosphate transferase subunits alpha and beta [Balamuthia mandrillaris]